MAKKSKKKARRKAARKTTARRTNKVTTKGARRGRRPTIHGISTDALRAELERREDGLAQLEAEYDAKLAELDALRIEIESLGGAPGAVRGRATGGRRAAPVRRKAGARKRPKNDMNLEEALAITLKGKQMGVTEAAEAVQKNGYRTNAANFRTIVNQTLIKSPLIKKVERGVYTAK